MKIYMLKPEIIQSYYLWVAVIEETTDFFLNARSSPYRKTFDSCVGYSGGPLHVELDMMHTNSNQGPCFDKQFKNIRAASEFLAEHSVQLLVVKCPICNSYDLSIPVVHRIFCNLCRFSGRPATEPVAPKWKWRG